ncbi:sortase [Candidatus Peregrinibacteria bacterium]|nr:sortase [Candidatus Peregrinibacteria bacterium]
MRWLYRLLLATGITMLIFGVVFAKEFSDVPATYKHYDAITAVADAHIVEGYTDGLFAPEQTINRAEAIKILVSAHFDKAEIRNALTWHWEKRHRYVWFFDVKISEWYAPYVEIGHNEGILQGDPDNHFRPADTVNLAEGLKMVLEAYGIGADAAMFQPSALLYAKTDDWFAPYFAYALDKQLISRQKFYHPAQLMTRAEFSEIVYRLKTIQEQGLAEYAETTPILSDEYRITIPILDIIDAPIGFGDPFDEVKSLEILRRFPLGHYLSTPDKRAKTVLFGHSSGYSWDASPYKQVLRKINKLQSGDTLYINYKEKGYAYQIYKTELIPAKQDDLLMADQNNNELVVFTCWPPDRIDYRYAVFGKPIS